MQRIWIKAVVVVALACLGVRAAEVDAVLVQFHEACGGKCGTATVERQGLRWRVVSADLWGSRNEFTDGDFRRISTLTELVRLGLSSDMQVTEEGWASLGTLGRLTSLRLGPVTSLERRDRVWKNAQLFPNLTEIRMALCDSASALKALAASARIEAVVYYGYNHGYRLSPVERDAVTAQWAAFPRLKRLVVADLAVGDEEAKAVAALKGLEELYLLGSAMGDRATPLLAGLVKLRSLSLNSIDQQGVDAIQTLPALESLEIGRSTAPSLDLSRLSAIRSLTLGNDLRPLAWGRPIRWPPNLQSLCMTAWVKEKDSAGKGVFEHPLPEGLKSVRLRLFEGSPADCVTPRQLAERRPSDLMWLRALPSLTELELIDPIAADFDSVLPLVRLRRLALAGDKGALNAEQVAQVNKLKHLESLKVLGQGVMTDSALGAIAEIKGLRELTVFATGTGVAKLWALSGLETLTLHLPLPNKVSDTMADESLTGIGALSQLKEFTLVGTVTDADLNNLGALKKLQYLNLSGCKGFTDGGLAALVKLLPELKTLLWTCRPEPKP